MLFVIDPAQHPVTLRCPIRTVGGFGCPVRGSLRAVHEVSHLQPAVALDSNPLLVLAVPVGGRVARGCTRLFNPRRTRSFPPGSCRSAPFSAFWLPLACYTTNRGSGEGPAHPQHSSSSPSELMSCRLTE
ncbi:MAG: DUF2752 domain-containing protein [Acidimicrobiales bacterium]